MTILRRFRSPLIALVAVVFSASIAAAGQPSGTGRANASNHAGKTVPVQASDPTQKDESAETDDTDTNESDSADNCTVDLSADLSSFTHGQIVCSAAHMDTPDGYANHGAWVSHWAKMNPGADASAAGKAHKPSH